MDLIAHEASIGVEPSIFLSQKDEVSCGEFLSTVEIWNLGLFDCYSTPMKKSERALKEITYYFSPRYILGIFLIILAFLSAYLITRASDRTITVWSATSNLAAGSLIEMGDLQPTQVRLLGNSSNYFTASQEIVGTLVLSPISANDLIPVGAITESVDTRITRVPLPIARESAPAGLSRGSIVDIYAVPDASQFGNGEGKSSRPKLILPAISIDAISGADKDFGSTLVVTLLVPESLVSQLIDSIPGNKFLLALRIMS